MLMTRIEGTLVVLERVGIMILLTPFGEPLPKWRVTRQFGLEELPVRNDPYYPTDKEHKVALEEYRKEHGHYPEFRPCIHVF